MTAFLRSIGMATKSTPSIRPEPMTTFFVSWRTNDRGGSTGRHYKHKSSANRKYKQLLAQGERPSKWYDNPKSTKG